MSVAAASPLRILVVGADPELAAVLHAQGQASGWLLFTASGPADLEPLVRAVSPTTLALVLPATPDTSWGAVLTVAQGAARDGVRVLMVAPVREVVEPLAAVAGAERALARAELFHRPTILEEPAVQRPGTPRTAPPAARPPPPTPPPVTPPTPPPAPAAAPAHVPSAAPTYVPPQRSVAPPSPPPTPPARSPVTSPSLAELSELPSRPAARPAPDLMSLIDEELVEERPRPPAGARVEVSVSLVSEHNFYVGTTRRIDSGGVFIATSMPPPVGTRIQLRLGLADGRKLDLEGEVSFLRAKSATTGRQPAGCGVRLVGIPGWAIDAIDRFFQARAPIAYAP